MEKQVENKNEEHTDRTTFSLLMKIQIWSLRLFILLLLGSVGYLGYVNFDRIKPLLEKQEEISQPNEVVLMQIQQLQNQMAQLQLQIANQPQLDVSEFEDKVASLEKYSLNVIDSKADAGIVLGLLTRVDKLENRLDKLAKISDDGALILSATMMLKEAAENGTDFVYEAEILNQLAENRPSISKEVSLINEFARNGVISKLALIKQYVSISDKLQHQPQHEDEQDWKERLTSKVNEYIKINKVNTESQQTDNHQELDSINILVAEGKIAQAVKLIESSDNDIIKQNQAIQEWLVDARNKLSFDKAIKTIAAACLAEMKVNNLKNKD